MLNGKTAPSDNKRIAMNALYMYIRMGIVMFAGLFTSRIILRSLGIIDYGIYNVIGGIIAMFIFFNNAMTNATSRYITTYLAKKNERKLNGIFNMTVAMHFGMAIFIVILGETVGLWYLHNKMVIPEERFFAAQILYQFTVVTSFISILYVPFNAVIIAHEKMNAFAYISIMDVIFKLAIALSLAYAPCDKLVFFGLLTAFVSILDIVIYFIYSKRNFPETKLKFYWNWPLFKKMSAFTGWSLVGNFSYIFYTQGINLILNLFCGPAVNAARGIAVQIENAIKQFSNNLQVAINPQIIKTYASDNLERMYSLIYASSKYCFFLLFLFSFPLMLEAEFVLNLWLGADAVPSHTVNFVRIILCVTILDALINPLYTANLASGKLKLYQICVCGVSYAFMIITYFAIKITNVPESVFLCLLVSTIIGSITRIFVAHHQVHLPIGTYIWKVYVRIIAVVATSVVLPIIVYSNLSNGWERFIASLASSSVCIVVSVYFVGLTSNERATFKRKIIEKFTKRNEK